MLFKNLATGIESKPLKGFKQGGAVGSLAHSSDGRLFAAGQDDGAVRLWETFTFQEMLPPLSVGGRVNSLAFGPVTLDRKRQPTRYLLAAGSVDGSIRTLEAVLTKDKSGARWTFLPTRVEFPRQEGMLGVRFSPDDTLLASARFGGRINLLDPDTGRSIREIKHGGANIDWISFHPREPWLAAAHWQDRMARIWNYETGDLLCELPGHTSGVFCAEFSPDGSRVATASDDFSIKLWNLVGPGISDSPTGPKAKGSRIRSSKGKSR